MEDRRSVGPRPPPASLRPRSAPLRVGAWRLSAGQPGRLAGDDYRLGFHRGLHQISLECIRSLSDGLLVVALDGLEAEHQSVPVGSIRCALSANAPVPVLTKLPAANSARQRRGDGLMRVQSIRL